VLLTIGDFIGRFHPLLVHLPIGILLLAVLLHYLSKKEKYHLITPAVRIALFWGMCSAIASAISGFLLSKTAEYEEPVLSRHQWLGIATAAVALLAWVLHKRNNRHLQWMLPLLVLLIVITGHLGGSLTHGSDYLTRSFSSAASGAVEEKQTVIPDVQQAVVYTDIIQPMLQAKCYSCHGTTKQKGKLRLDGPDFILQGGKSGNTIVIGKKDESELVKRIQLAHDNKKHMPPKEKPQLTKDEIALLQWWISNGADFKKRVADLPQPERIKPVLAALQNGKKKEETELSYIPETPVEKADEVAINRLKEIGVSIVPVSQNSNYLSANFVAVDSITRENIELLLPLSKQLIWLKLGNTQCTDSAITGIGKLTSLTRLSLENTTITDKGLLQLKEFVQLRYLNVSGTKITAKGLSQLTGLAQLRNLFIYKGQVSPSEFEMLRKSFPKAVIDTGGYRLAMLESDTTIVKNPK